MHLYPDTSSAGAEICALIRQGDTADFAAAIKLKPAEDSSCMWVIRCESPQMRVTVKEALEG